MKKFILSFLFLIFSVTILSNAYAIKVISNNTMLSSSRIKRYFIAHINNMPNSFFKEYPLKNLMIKAKIRLILKKGITRMGFKYNIISNTTLNAYEKNKKSENFAEFQQQYFAITRRGVLVNPDTLPYTELKNTENTAILKALNNMFTYNFKKPKQS
jgi:hypothetical protein